MRKGILQMSFVSCIYNYINVYNAFAVLSFTMQVQGNVGKTRQSDERVLDT